MVVGKGNEGIESVITATELNDDQDGSVALGAGILGVGALGKEGRRKAAECEEAETTSGALPDEFTSSQGGW